MKFINKLIEDTRLGKLDFVWNFNEPDKYIYKQQFDPLTNLNFSLSMPVMINYNENGKSKSKIDATKGLIIFPDGASLEVDKFLLEELNTECGNAILRAMDSLISSFTSGEIEADVAAKNNQSKLNKSKSKSGAKDVNNGQEGN